MKVIDVQLDQIIVGERRRQDFGDIGALAKGIQRVGLLSAIVVDRNGKKDCYRLVAGERRLRAVQMLKWKAIPASLLEHLTDEELRDLELEENEDRKSLTEQERKRVFGSSKKLLESVRKAGEVSPQSAAKPLGGRPTKYGKSKDELAQDLGISKDTIERAEQHVATAEAFPFMQGNEWKQSDVLRVRERLQEIGPEAREQTMAILGAARMLDPELAVTLVENIGAKKPAERLELFNLSQSTDPRERSRALTEAAKLPPMPDPRLGIIDNATRILAAAIRPFPKDPLTPKLIEVRKRLQDIRVEVKEVSYDASREQKKEILQ